MKYFFSTFIVTLVTLMLSIGNTYAEERLAILEFKNTEKAVSSSELSYISEVFRDLGAKKGKRGLLIMTIMTKENILQMLPPGKSLEQCIGECEVETGRKIGANYILSGEIIKLGEGLGYRLTAKIHNTKSGGLMSSEIYEGETFKILEKDIRSNTNKDVFKPLRSSNHAVDFQEKSFGEKAGSVQTWGDSSIIVEFDTDPKGAFVEIDGAIVCQQTPCSKEVALGSHEIAFKLMQYLPLAEQIDVKKDIKPITRTLKADFGLVTLKTEPAEGLEVFIDNKSIGKTPLSTFKVEPRPHKLVVKADGYYEKGVEFKMERGEKREFTLKPDPKLGALKVLAKDDKGNDVMAEVSIDGNTVGKTPWQGTLVVGNHAIKVTHTTGAWQAPYLVKFNEKQQIVANLKMTEEESRVKGWVKVGEGMYKDIATGITWARFDGKVRNWQDSIDYCKNLTCGGVGGWQLPSRDQLIDAYNNGIWGLQGISQLNLASYYFWSASWPLDATQKGWSVGLSGGSTYDRSKTDAINALCIH